MKYTSNGMRLLATEVPREQWADDVSTGLESPNVAVGSSQYLVDEALEESELGYSLTIAARRIGSENWGRISRGIAAMNIQISI